jgi:thiosulfate/3-mercaptopyruvate sulfurtransferase
VSALITPEELAGLLAAGEGRPALLDVRWALGGPPGREEYDRGHVPGAVFVDLDTELAGTPGRGGRHPLPDGGAFEAAMRAAGVRGDRPAVVYDAASSMAAARAWWLLRYFGHPDVRVLDGGLAAWMAAGQPVATEAPAPERGEFTARPGGMPVLDADGAAELASRGVLLDARAPERFRGEQEPIDPVAGHIPGAVNVPSAENVDGEGRFLGPAELRERFAGVGLSDAAGLGAYCGSGVTAAHEVLALELAGFPAALYPGSWSEWITDPKRPVARDAG